MIEGVIVAALNNALETLRPRFGLRSHALPTEENIDGCVKAVEQVVAKRGLTSTHVVIGSSRTPKAVPTGFVVLPCDEAAAEATRIRSEVPAAAGQPHILYFNSDSTPGEAGLSELDELTATDIALAYARSENLPLLQTLASSNARVVRARVLDAGIPDLARYAELAREKTEQYAAPLLGFLVNPQTGSASATRAASAFDALSGPRAVEALASAKKALDELSGSQRDSVAQTLRDRFGITEADPIREATRLAEAATNYATGKNPDPENLCGLTAELASALRSGPGVVRRLGGDQGQDEPGAIEASSGTLNDAELLTRSDGAALLGSDDVRFDFDSEDNDDEGALPRITIANQGEEIVLRPSGRDPLVDVAVHQAVTPQFWQRGGTLLAADVELYGDQLAALSENALVDWSWFAKAGAAAPQELKEPIETYLARREELFTVIGERICGEKDALTTSVRLIEHFPLLIAAQFPDNVRRYVEGYESLLAVALEIDPLPQDLAAWLANMDLALSADASRLVRSACLLPTHPLRLAHAQLWLQQSKEPPAVPLTLGVYYQQAQPLSTAGRDYAYAVVNKGNPSDTGLAAAGREGLEAVWSVLRARDLASALQIELINVLRPAVVINELVAHAGKLLDDDADAPGIHLDVRITYSGATYEREVAHPVAAEFSTECSDALSARRADGVSLSIAPEPMKSGEPCDLAIEAVDAPFVRLPDAGMEVVLPETHLIYRPGSAGNIALIEISGFGPLDRYQRLLVDQLQLSSEARGLSPLVEGPRGESALVKASVARRGWPVMPKNATSVLSRQEIDDHIVLTTLAGDVFGATVPTALNRVTAAAPDLKAASIVEGVLNLYSCRAFVRQALEGSPDVRDLRGKLGKLRAYEASRAKSGVVRLVLDLDGSEGLRWIQTVAKALNLENKRRCDLLFVDVDTAKKKVLALCAVELKAGESKNNLSDKELSALAYQAQLTSSRLRATFDGATPEHYLIREALRRLYWMGAGSQLLALDLRGALEDLDQRLWASDPPPIEIQCWIVPEEPWPGEKTFTRALRAVGPNGEELATDDSVEFHVLDPIASPATPPSSNAPPRRQSAAEPSAQARPAPSGSPAPAGSAGAEPTTVPTSNSGSASGGALAPEATSTITAGESQLGAVDGAGAAIVPDTDGMRVVFGSVGSDPAIWLPNRTDLVNHFNVGITGTMGTGKTQFTKSLLAQLLWESSKNVGGRRPGVLIFDYKGDYVDSDRDPYASRLGLTVLKPEGLPINPLRYVRPKTRQQFVALPRMFADTLRTIDSRMGNVQRHEIIQAVQQCYEAAGITDSPNTWERPFPTVRELFELMKSEGIGAGTPQSIVQDLADYGVFAADDPVVDLDAFFDGAHVVDLRELAATPTLIRAILCFFMNAFYDRMVQGGEAALESRGANSLRQLRRLILVDEADDFISLNLHTLILTMQQGRSFGHGVFLSTQFLHHFNQNETPLRPLIGTWILHQMADLNPADVKVLFGLSSRSEVNERVQELSSLPQHMSLCLGLSNEGMRARLTKMRDLPYKDLASSRKH